MSKFRLQSVLDYRQTLEDMAQQKLAEALMVEQRLTQQKQKIEAEISRWEIERRQKEDEGMTIADLHLYQTRLDHQHRAVEEVSARLAQAHEATARCQQQVLKASQEKEAMEKLKEKDALRQETEEKQQETKDLDEVGSRGRPSS